jgi:hypothetical protein
MKYNFHGTMFLSQPQLQMLKGGTFHVGPAQTRGLYHEVQLNGKAKTESQLDHYCTMAVDFISRTRQSQYISKVIWVKNER